MAEPTADSQYADRDQSADQDTRSLTGEPTTPLRNLGWLLTREQKAEAVVRTSSGEAASTSSRSLGSLVQDLEAALAERIEEVRKAELQVTNETRLLQEEKHAMGVLGLPAQTSDVLRLNVGGRLFTTKRSTLTQVESSVWNGMFSGRWDKSFDLDDEGRIFLDLDPDCFAEVLHQLRLLQLSGQSEVNWSKVLPPERREIYFRAMLDFLGLAKLPVFAANFAFFHPSIVRGENEVLGIRPGSAVMSPSEGHKWAIGETVMEAGTYMWSFKIHQLQNNNWMFLGVIASTRPVDNSFTDPTSYGWACRGSDGQHDAFVRGVSSPGYGGWSGFHQGDDVTMQLNVDSGVLRMKVVRLQQTVYHYTGLHQAPWRIHVNLHGAGDCVELLSSSQF